MFRVVKFLVLGTVVLGLVSCGKTNPAEDYSYMPTKPLQINSYANTDERLHTPAFAIRLAGLSEKNFANFIEGQPGSIQFIVTPLFPAISDEILTSADKPSWAQFAKVGPHTWALQGTPPVGAVLPTVGSTTIPCSVIAHVLTTSDPNLQNLYGIAPNFNITVSKTGVMPLISGVNGYKEEINEGESFSFSVDVRDPATKLAPADLIIKAFDSGENRENFKMDGTRFIQALTKGALTQGSNGLWTRHYIFSTAGFSFDPRQLPDPTANSVKVCETFIAMSATGNLSHDENECTEVRFTAQSPEFSFEGYPINYVPINLKAGTLNTIKFQASIQNQRGVAEVKNTSLGFANWSGGPQMSCANGDHNDASVQNCVITWQIPCKPQRSKYDLSLVGTNTQVSVNGKAKGKPITRTLVIAPADAQCADSKTQVVPVTEAVTKQNAAPQTKTAPAPTKDLAARRAKGQSVGALPANSTVAPDTKLDPKLKDKPAQFAVQNPRKPTSAEKPAAGQAAVDKSAPDKSAVSKSPVVSPNRTTQHAKLPMGDRTHTQKVPPKKTDTPKKNAAKPEAIKTNVAKPDAIKTQASDPAAQASPGGSK